MSSPTIDATINGSDYKAIGPKTDMQDLDILCDKCSVVDKKGKIIVKHLFKYISRDELFKCLNCHRVISESQVRYVLKMEIEEHIQYLPDEPIKKIYEKKKETDPYFIKPNNPIPLGMSSNDKAIVIKRNNNNQDNKDKKEKW